MMRKTCAKESKNYTPVYFNFKCGNENVGGCAIWIMDLYPSDTPIDTPIDTPTQFAYFYGLHKFPQFLDIKDKFSSHKLLSSVITFCKEKNIDFICLPRPCLIVTTKLWYSIGMTFPDEDRGGYLSYLKDEPQRDEALKNHSSNITNDLLRVYNRVTYINSLEQQMNNTQYGPFETSAITNTGGLLYRDNYNTALTICSKQQQGGKNIRQKTKSKRQKAKDKKQKTKNKRQKTKDKKQKTKNKKQKQKTKDYKH